MTIKDRFIIVLEKSRYSGILTDLRGLRQSKNYRYNIFAQYKRGMANPGALKSRKSLNQIALKRGFDRVVNIKGKTSTMTPGKRYNSRNSLVVKRVLSGGRVVVGRKL